MDRGEKNIFRELTNGSEKAFAYFFKKYYRLLFNYAFQILKDQLAAEEIVEETFLAIWEKRIRINLQRSPASYLFKATYNQCLNYLKHKQIENKYQAFFLHHIPDPELDDSSNSYPLSTLIGKEIEETLEKSIEKLPEQCRRVFIMSRLEDKKNKEIAEILNVSVSTVKTQLMRSLSRIREDLKHFYLMIF